MYTKEKEDIEIRIGSYTESSPYLIENLHEELSGIEQDLINLLRKKMNKQIILVKGTRQEMEEALDEGRITAILADAEWRDESEDLTYSQEIFATPLAVFSQNQSIYQLRINQFSNSRIGVPRQTEAARTYLDNLNIPFIDVESTEAGLASLSQGDIDFLLDDLFYTKYLADTRNIKISIKGIIENDRSRYALIFPRTANPLQTEFDDAITQIKKEELYFIRNRWIGLYPGQKFDRMEYTDEEIAWIESHPEIPYRGNPDMGPILFSQNNELIGIVPDILQIVSEQTSIFFLPIEDSNWTESLMASSESRDSILPAVSLDNTMLTDYAFTDPYLTVPNVIIARKNDRIYINAVEEMASRKIVLVKNMSASHHMRKMYPGLNYVIVETVKDALRAVVQSKADFYVGDMITGSYYINKAGYTQLAMVGDINYDMDLRIAVPDTMLPLVPILNRALSQITPGEYTSVIQKWTSLRLEDSINYTLLGQILVVFAVIITIILIWNRKLKLEIQERQRSEEALRYSEHKAREAEELSRIARERAEKLAVMAEAASQAKSQFLANMSHEIRTPLNSIIGFTELLETTALSGTQDQYLDSVKTSAEVLLVLINDVLDISKIEAGKMKVNLAPVKLSKIFNDMKVIFSQRAKEKGLNMKFLDSELLQCEFLLDSLRLEQVLINLIGNSIKFTEKGFITVSARFRKYEDSDSYDITLTVADSGIGILEEERDKIFHLFEQSETQDTRRFGGTGLGLGISNKLVELMKGEIHVDSMYGKGSVFSVNLPDVNCVGECAGKIQEISGGRRSRIRDGAQVTMDWISDEKTKEKWVRIRESGDPEAIKRFCHQIMPLEDVQTNNLIKNTIENMILAAEEFDLDRIILLSDQMDKYFVRTSENE